MTARSPARRWPAWIVLAALALPWAVAFARADEPASPPLTDEDVVRMVASGMSEERVVARIRESPGRFDLSPEMVEELKAAGVTAAILEAMRRKPAPAEAAPAAPPGAAKPAPKGWIEIYFDDDPDRPPAENSVVAPAAARDETAKRETPVELAFAVTCTQPAHVPDQWHTKSPLGATPGRHEILFFQAATAPAPPIRKGLPLVYLPHPPQWKFEVDAGVHRGLLLVAARLATDAKYTVMAAESYEDVEVKEGLVTRLDIRVRSERPRGGRDASRPVASRPELVNIGTTAESIGLWPATIKLLQVHAP